MSMYVCKAEFSALKLVGETFVVDSQKMQYGRIEVLEHVLGFELVYSLVHQSGQLNVHPLRRLQPSRA